MSRVTIRPFSPKDLQAVLALLAQPDMDDGRVLSEPEAQALIKQIACILTACSPLTAPRRVDR